MDGDMTPREVADAVAQGAVELIDVREPDEVAAGRIAGIRHVPLGALSEAAASIPRDRPVVFVCRSGGRSAMATEAFRTAGYEAHNMTGGMLEWLAGGLPIEPENGRVT
jgi:rhodanese-related sulfurtransferase